MKSFLLRHPELVSGSHQRTTMRCRNKFGMTFVIVFFVMSVLLCGISCFADETVLRDYDGIEIPKGTFIPVISTQEISTEYCDIGTKLKFISTTDLFLYETNIIPKETEFYGYIEKINEPVLGTNASMVIKVIKLKLSDGFEIPARGYIIVNNSPLIGGELTDPASYDKKPSYRQGFRGMVGYVPGPTRKMGEHKVIASGADLLILLVSPLYITHTITN